MYDSKILYEQLDNKYLISDDVNNKNKEVLLGDKAYDSNKLRLKLSQMKYKKLITPQNKRNIKNKKLLIKMSKRDKQKFNKRTIIERMIAKLKSYKRLNVRYDKFSYMYEGFVHLACICELYK
jgi:transposase